jgi:predicted transcriptional regulator
MFFAVIHCNTTYYILEAIMLKAANLTVRVKTTTKKRLEALARATKRSKSYVIEEALEHYLDVNEWQIKGIEEALADADSPDAEWISHEDVLKGREAKVADKLA